MTVKEYLKKNPNKAAYTIKQGRKSYLCTVIEAYRYFGDREIKRISNKYYNSEELPLLTLI